MSLVTLLSQTVTIIRASQATPTIDAEGNPTAEPTHSDVPGLIQEQNATEVRVGPDTLISNHRLFLGPSVAIDGRDRVSEGGRLFEVIGAPDVLRTPMGPHHIECNLREVTD